MNIIELQYVSEEENKVRTNLNASPVEGKDKGQLLATSFEIPKLLLSGRRPFRAIFIIIAPVEFVSFIGG